ncbi:hypothetical protein KAI87_07500, partial [Myxococcota bacterium]|nr:hypothetical protein [Myxococcota bacterium]
MLSQSKLKNVSSFIIILVTSLSMACSSSTSGSNSSCSDNSQCDPGFVCDDSGCVQLCTTQSDCPEGMLCTSDVCRVPANGILPDIQGVTGNAADDNAQIIDGLIVDGTNLSESIFELRDENGAATLTIRSMSNEQVELVFPEDVRSGHYTLVATNQSGSDDQNIQLTLPEITGTQLIDKLNDTATTGTISAAHLPLGTGADSVAAGDHNHDSVYLKLSDAAAYDETFVNSTGDRISGDIIIDGLLGIGISNPSAPLQVAPGGFDYAKTTTALETNSEPRCACDTSDDSLDCEDFHSNEYYGAECFDWWQLPGDGAIREDLFTTTQVPTLTVTDSGQVGINTTTPEADLHVAGTLKVDNLDAAIVASNSFSVADHHIANRGRSMRLDEMVG